MRWWRKWPTANIGIPTGPKSGLLVLDVDGQQGMDTLAELEAKHGHLPETWRVITGKEEGGYHFYFRYPENVEVPNKTRFAPGLDTRARGGLVIVPPSLYANGRRYQWEPGSDPGDAKLVVCPKWLIDEILSSVSSNGHKTANGLNPNGWVAKALEGVEKGRRDNTAIKLAGYFFGKGISRDAVLAILRLWNSERNKPPMSDQQIEKVVNSGSKWEVTEMGAKILSQSKLQSLKNVVNKWLRLEYDKIIDVIVATYIAVKLDGDPLWVMIIAPPSSAKTELIMGLADCPRVYVLSTLTPQSLISGFKDKSNKDHSLIKKLNNKLVIYKDFTSILSMRNEPRQEILAQCREVFDGRLTRAFGTGVTTDWQGKVAMLCGVTPIIDKHYSVSQMLGERFIYLRLDGGNPIEIGHQALKTVGKEKEMRAEIRGAFKTCIDSLMKSPNGNIHIPEELKNKVVHLATFAATARTGIARNYRTQEIESDPSPEGSPRLTKQLFTLGIALAITHEKDHLDVDIFDILKKAGRDTIPALRLKIIDRLNRHDVTATHLEHEQTNKISEIANLPTTTTRYILEELNALNLVDRKAGMPDKWCLSEYCCCLLDAIEGKQNGNRNDKEEGEYCRL